MTDRQLIVLSLLTVVVAIGIGFLAACGSLTTGDDQCWPEKRR